MWYSGKIWFKFTRFTDLPNLPFCPDTAKITTLPIYLLYHGLKSGEIYQFTDLPNLPHETEVKPQIGKFMFCVQSVGRKR